MAAWFLLLRRKRKMLRKRQVSRTIGKVLRLLPTTTTATRRRTKIKTTHRDQIRLLQIE